ncbi:antigen-presenting glycoprotein CD1d-like isoform X4 [Corapipo altera]|uniref:antigen-presenting glycoprotein CD1d-like isoform X4 n=1 Tax=Corapipo altera TaxID=415028 RepID=UPI000FD6B603|nr:antigen-presenting glycoprotein CD1d-like isoform X4 [Corapipo altera]
MQPPHLFLFLPLLLPGMWADPEAEPQVLQYLLTGLFANMTSAEVSATAVLGDVPIFALDPANWSVHFHWPWVSQAAAEGDTKKLMSQSQMALRNMVRYVHEKVQQTEMDYPLVVQIRAGCELHPNTSSWGFLHVGEGGKDLVAFEVDEERWEMQQASQLAEQVITDLNRATSIKVLLEHLLSFICQRQIRTLNKYGRATLERQALQRPGRGPPGRAQLRLPRAPPQPGHPQPPRPLGESQHSSNHQHHHRSAAPGFHSLCRGILVVEAQVNSPSHCLL